MNETPLVSVIMPAYNAGLFIRKSIESVQQQTNKDWELIIIDDGSTDNTKEVVQSKLSYDSRVRYLYQENNKQASARNRGIKVSRGEYIAFLDADDLWLPERLDKGITHMLEKTADLLFSQGYFQRDTKTHYDVDVREQWDEENIPEFISKNRIPICSVIVKKSTLVAAGGFNESLPLQNAEDYELWLRLLFLGFKFKSIEDRLFVYRIHTAQATYESDKLHQPIISCFSILYTQFNDHQYTYYLIGRLVGFLSFKSFRSEAEDVILDYLQKYRPGKAWLYSSLSWLPNRYKNKLLQNFLLS